MPDEIDLREALAVAVDAAHQAGVLIAGHQLADVVVDYKGGVEPVTAADIASDRLITRCLSAAFPHHRVLSEESAAPGWAANDFSGALWVVDPIDGTANYARRHRYVSISIALAIDGLVQVGVVHAPFLDETFTAIRGAGALLNGHPITVGRPVSLSRAIVSTGFPHRKTDVDALVERVRRLLTSCQDIRRAASPALDICWVAAGRLDAHTESMAPWDVAAAALVAVEAGARRGHLSPVPPAAPPELCGDEVVIAAPTIHDELTRLLAS